MAAAMTRSSNRNRRRKLPGECITPRLTPPVRPSWSIIRYCRTLVGAGKGGGDEASDTGGTAISGVAVAAGVGTLIGPAVPGTAGVLTGTGSSLGTGRLTRA